MHVIVYNLFLIYVLLHITFVTELMVSSSRVSTLAEDDLRSKATKKVKNREGGGVISMSDGNQREMEGSASYREALLNVQGVTFVDEEGFEDMDDEDLPENRWYKDQEAPSENGGVREDPTEKVLIRQGRALVIQVTDDDLKEWCEAWSLTLVVNVLGKKINFRILENKIRRDWARKGKVTITDMPRGFYVVQFSEVEDYRHALFEGPWMVADHYILVQRWRPNFLRSAKMESKVAVWVRVPELPLELYNDKFFKRLGAALGVLLKVDRLTSIHSRGQFTRICVEIDLAKPLDPQVEVRGEIINLEYTGLHSVCFNCGVYGHRAANCRLSAENMAVPVHHGGEATPLEAAAEGDKEENPRADVSTMGGSGNNLSINDGEAIKDPNDLAIIGTDTDDGSQRISYGPWMLSKKQRRSNPRRGQSSGVGQHVSQVVGQEDHNKQGDVGTGSRFDVLGVIDDPMVDVDNRTQEDVGQASNQESITNEENGRDTDISRTNSNKDKGKAKSSGQVVLKVRNKMGGKNPQLGPRVRDVKKAARGIGSIQQAVSASQNKSKEKNHPNNKKPVPAAGTKDISVLAAELQKLDKKRFQENLEKLRREQKGSSSGGGTPMFIDPNPLLDFIKDIEENARQNAQADEKAGSTEVASYGLRLSEPNQSNLS